MQSRSSIQPDEVQMAAAADALAVQDACNIVAIVGAFQRQLLALHRSGICGDDLINHPVAIAFTSKLNSLCRLSLLVNQRHSIAWLSFDVASQSTTRSFRSANTD